MYVHFAKKILHAECLYRNHVQPAFQNVLLADITAQQLEDFYSKLLAVLAPSTVNKIKASILDNALRKAYAQRLIAYDPTVEIDHVRGEDRHHEAYTGEEIRKLAAASQRTSGAAIAPAPPFPLSLAAAWKAFACKQGMPTIGHSSRSTSTNAQRRRG